MEIRMNVCAISVMAAIVVMMSGNCTIVQAADYSSTKAGKKIYEACLPLLSGWSSQVPACTAIAGTAADRGADLKSACQERCRIDVPPTNLDTQKYYDCYNTCAKIYTQP